MATKKTQGGLTCISPVWGGGGGGGGLSLQPDIFWFTGRWAYNWVRFITNSLQYLITII